MHDVRFALRILSKHPGFTAAVVLSLALGIGANTAIFTLIDAVMWRLLPIKDPQTLLVVARQSGDGRREAMVSDGFCRHYQRINEIPHALPHCDAAIVSGPAHVVIEPGGKRTELELHFTELYVREGGQWRMALWQSTRLPAPAPTTK